MSSHFASLALLSGVSHFALLLAAFLLSTPGTQRALLPGSRATLNSLPLGDTTGLATVQSLVPRCRSGEVAFQRTLFCSRSFLLFAAASMQAPRRPGSAPGTKRTLDVSCQT